MREAIAPYTRFVRTEHARMTEARDTLAELDGEVDSLKREISAPGLDPNAPRLPVLALPLFGAGFVAHVRRPSVTLRETLRLLNPGQRPLQDFLVHRIGQI